MGREKSLQTVITTGPCGRRGKGVPGGEAQKGHAVPIWLGQAIRIAGARVILRVQHRLERVTLIPLLLPVMASACRLGSTDFSWGVSGRRSEGHPLIDRGAVESL